MVILGNKNQTSAKEKRSSELHKPKILPLSLSLSRVFSRQPYHGLSAEIHVLNTPAASTVKVKLPGGNLTAHAYLCLIPITSAMAGHAHRKEAEKKSIKPADSGKMMSYKTYCLLTKKCSPLSSQLPSTSFV